MSIKTTTYVRNPLYVEAVQVTKENFEELASWCQGEIVEPLAPSGKYYERHIQVRVTNPMNPRQAQARIGDWILTSDRGYKIYTPKAFANSFHLAEEPPSPGPGARQLFQEDQPAGVAAALHQQAKEGDITAEEADAAIIATPLEPVKPPVGSGPMPEQSEPTDTEVKHVPGLPENLRDENTVYPPGHIYGEEEDDGA